MKVDCLLLCEAVAASMGEWNAKPALAPEFTLRELEELKVVVVPTELTYKNISRALKERTVKLQIGFMKRAKDEELDELLATVEKLGMSFLNCGNGISSRASSSSFFATSAGGRSHKKSSEPKPGARNL